MADKFDGSQAGLDSPAFDAGLVAPSDVTDLAQVARALYIGTTGHLVVLMKNGQEVFFKNVPVGIFPISVKRVKSASSWSPTDSTTAADIVALW